MSPSSSCMRLCYHDLTTVMVFLLVWSSILYTSSSPASPPRRRSSRRQTQTERPRVTAALKNVHLLPAKQRSEYKLCRTHAQSKCQLVFGIHVGHAHCLFRCFGTQTTFICRWKYIISRRIRKLGERAFSVSGPLLWNTLPNDNKAAQSTDTFKRFFKTYLLKIGRAHV